MADMTRKIKATGRMYANNSWWVSELLVADLKRWRAFAGVVVAMLERHRRHRNPRNRQNFQRREEVRQALLFFCSLQNMRRETDLIEPGHVSID